MVQNFNVFDIEYKENLNAKELTTMKADANIKIVYYPKNEEELIGIYNYLTINNINFIVIGNGSNIIFTEKARNVTVICTKKVCSKITLKNNILTANCSTMLSSVYNFTKNSGLSGFEKLAGIPGNLGGAIIMNASAFGSSIFDYLISVKIFKNGKIINIKKEKINLNYRDSGLKNCLLLSAKFILPKKDKSEIEKDFYKYLYLRQEKQPKELSSGSIFKNPPLVSAGKLIEECGLKGLQIGDAKISEKHGNFIINLGNANINDILELIFIIKTKVYKKFNIKLEEEVRLV